MSKIISIRMGCVVAALVFLGARYAAAETVLAHIDEYRFQIDLHAPEAAVQKFLPAGWEADVAPEGSTKDVNLRMIFVDRIDQFGADGKTQSGAPARSVYLEVPVKQTTGNEKGRMTIGGLSEDPSDVPGAFGNYKKATKVSMSRSTTEANGIVTVDETWSLASADGEQMQVHVKFERGAPRRIGGDVKFFDPRDPTKYQLFRTDQAIDVARNLGFNPPDHVKEFSYKATGKDIAALFDGTEKPMSWDSFPWYQRTVSAP